MTYQGIERLLPRFLRRYVLHFESAIDDSLESFAASVAAGAFVLDAGAGERLHAKYFTRNRYVGVDLAVGDAAWDYGKLDAVADLTALLFAMDASTLVSTSSRWNMCASLRWRYRKFSEHFRRAAGC